MGTHMTMDLHEESQEHSGGRIGLFGWIAIVAGAIVLGWLMIHTLTAGDHVTETDQVPHAPPLWGLGILPFLGILGSIAFLPLLPWTHHWWENNLNRLLISLICTVLTLVYVWAALGLNEIITVLQHAIVIEYLPFIMLLFALYVISGGIRLTGDLAAKPSTNTAFLAIGALLASFIGTTGASMLLIRPLLQTNSERKHVLHTVIFFIFLVSNVGGTLLPIGDPPLFLGYLRGVDFFWTMNLAPQWAVCCVMLLVIYYFWDRRAYAREDKASLMLDATRRAPLRLTGSINILWLVGIVVAVAFISDQKPFMGTTWTPFMFLREIVMLIFVGLSLITTRPGIRAANHFNYHAILEVGALFIGIFIAMQIPLEVLHAFGPDITKNAVTEPWHFFWATGGLSSFLDNAPTYVVFFELAKTMEVGEAVEMVPLTGRPGGEIPAPMLVAVSLGAVFMGAMTYIGNGPNFMVKSIAEQSGIRMPSFFGYMIKYSVPILIPVFIVVMVLFLL